MTVKLLICRIRGFNQLIFIYLDLRDSLTANCLVNLTKKKLKFNIIRLLNKTSGQWCFHLIKTTFILSTIITA